MSLTWGYKVEIYPLAMELLAEEGYCQTDTEEIECVTRPCDPASYLIIIPKQDEIPSAWD